MIQKIKRYIKSLQPGQLGLKNKITVSSILNLGIGSGNLNYRVIANNKKFIFRMNIETKNKNKSREEFDALRIVEKLAISPKAYILDESRSEFNESFIVIDYIEGRSLDKLKGKVNNQLIKVLAQKVALLHETNISKIKNSLKKSKSSAEALLSEVSMIKKRIDYVKSKEEGHFIIFNMLKNSYQHYKHLPYPKKIKLVLGHGDIAPQNIIWRKKGLKFIDWEDLGLVDPALEIVRIYDAFNFNNKQKEIFIKEYLKIRKDNKLGERVSILWPFQLFEVLTWAIVHVYEVKEGDIYREFIKQNSIIKDIKFAQFCLNRAIKEKSINKKYKNVDLDEMLR